ncbi:ABC transporter permease [Kineosporia babensis]|uniref:ABC transporter permease n=1 Tax=Kineosporia babensis TaxID=499548 RepID=A0A9X1NKA0_9ACTN|nr:ABC transporter permease [Kineosporia babensis]MCD5315241.1 ABC transporter permease [Kineosporia babensis]
MSEPDNVAALEKVEGAPGTPSSAVPEVGRSRTLGGDAWETLRGSWVFWGSLILIGVLVVMAIWPGLFTSVDPRACDAARSRQEPSGAAWFGYDVQGCDVYARTMYGARASMMVGGLSTLMALLLGAGMGIYAGFYGGWIDILLSRVTDIFIGIPILLGSIIILSSIPTPPDSDFLNVLKVSLAIAVLAWPSTARVARSAVIQVKQADFVAASRALGASRGWMIRKHILPNAAAPVIVITTISLGGYIGAEATLSFLGIGLQPPVVSWGIAINDAAAYIRNTPHMLFFPAIFLSLTVLAFIALGDVVREALDPKAM